MNLSKNQTGSLLLIAGFILLGVLLMSFSKPSALLSSSVKSVSGTVSNLQNDLVEYVNPEKPTHDDSAVYYQRFFVSSFHLNNQTIEAQFSTPMKMSNGDVVTVSGYQKSHRFQVLAYRNQTQQVMGAENWGVLALGALFFLAVAIGLLNSELVPEGALMPKVFLSGFVLLAIYMAYRALLIREAIGLLQSS